MANYRYYCSSCKLEKAYHIAPSDPKCEKCGKKMELMSSHEHGRD